jgi:hypothetical protein
MGWEGEGTGGKGGNGGARTKQGGSRLGEGRGEEGGGDLALSERALSEFGDPDYQLFLQSLVGDGDDFLFADEEEEKDPTYVPHEEEGGRARGRDGTGAEDASDAESSGSGSMGSSEEEEEEEGGEEEEEEEEDEIPLQEVEELLADNGAMDYLSSLREQWAPPVSTSGGDGGRGAGPGGGRGQGSERQGSAFPPRSAQGRPLVPLFPSHPGPRFGLSPSAWQALMHTGVREEERGRLASQMARHVQLLVQNGAVLAHDLQGGKEGGGEEGRRWALGEVEAMVRDIHTLRNKAWEYFGYEPGPTGKGIYREREGRRREGEKAGGAEAGGRKRGRQGEAQGQRFTRGAAQRLEGRSKSLMDVPGIAGASDLCTRLVRLGNGEGKEAGEVKAGKVSRRVWVARMVEAYWGTGGLQVPNLTLQALHELPPLALLPALPPASLPHPPFTPAESRLFVRGLVVLPGGTGHDLHRLVLRGRSPAEIAWFRGLESDPEVDAFRSKARLALSAIWQRAPLAGMPKPFTEEEDALLWMGRRGLGARWGGIAKSFLPHRLPHDLLMRWRRIEFLPPPPPEVFRRGCEERKAAIGEKVIKVPYGKRGRPPKERREGEEGREGGRGGREGKRGRGGKEEEEESFPFCPGESRMGWEDVDVTMQGLPVAGVSARGSGSGGGRGGGKVVREESGRSKRREGKGGLGGSDFGEGRERGEGRGVGGEGKGEAALGRRREEEREKEGGRQGPQGGRRKEEEREKEGGRQGPQGGRRKEVKIRPEAGGRRQGRKRGREGKEEGKEEEGRRSVGWDEEGGRGSETLWSFPALSPGKGSTRLSAWEGGGTPSGGRGRDAGGGGEGGRGGGGRRREGGRGGWEGTGEESMTFDGFAANDLEMGFSRMGEPSPPSSPPSSLPSSSRAGSSLPTFSPSTLPEPKARKGDKKGRGGEGREEGGGGGGLKEGVSHTKKRVFRGPAPEELTFARLLQEKEREGQGRHWGALPEEAHHKDEKRGKDRTPELSCARRTSPRKASRLPSSSPPAPSLGPPLPRHLPPGIRWEEGGREGEEEGKAGEEDGFEREFVPDDAEEEGGEEEEEFERDVIASDGEGEGELSSEGGRREGPGEGRGQGAWEGGVRETFPGRLQRPAPPRELGGGHVLRASPRRGKEGGRKGGRGG